MALISLGLITGYGKKENETNTNTSNSEINAEKGVKTAPATGK